MQKFNREYNASAKEILEDGERKINYLKLKEFLVKLGLVTETAVNSDSTERALSYDFWRILKGESNENVHVEDMRVVVLTILRMTEHKRIGLAPPDESEDAGFFNSDQRFCIKQGSIPYIQKHFELFYLNRLQFLGKIKKTKVVEEPQATFKPHISKTTEKIAEQYRQKVSEHTHEEGITSLQWLAGTGNKEAWREQAK